MAPAYKILLKGNKGKDKMLSDLAIGHKKNTFKAIQIRRTTNLLLQSGFIEDGLLESKLIL
eukprot:SAG31_NODE_354_length_17223_cov_18.708771_10_plen_61_part_00